MGSYWDLTTLYDNAKEIIGKRNISLVYDKVNEDQAVWILSHGGGWTKNVLPC